MSLTASMWTSVSGLLVHGEAMNVVGNNISNVNTVGFKGSRMDFQDFVYQEIGTAAGIGQVGRGTSVGIVMKDFSQAAFQTSSTTTDIAIGGNGFFQVKPLNDNTTYYTRAGNFRFNKDGYLVDPHGYALQGWKVDNESRSLLASTGAVSSTGSRIIGTGTPVDIKLDKFSVDPRHTTNMTLALNLDSAQGNDKSVDTTDPFFSLLKKWRATPDSLGNINPLPSNAYAYSTTMEVFDEGGQAQKLTIYFDRVTQDDANSITGMTNNQVVWEYIVTMDPAKDQRDFDEAGATTLDPRIKGLLMAGTLTFDSAGQLRDQTAYVPTSNGTGTADDPADLDTWVQAPISASGFPMFNPNFSGRPDSSNIWDPLNPTQVNRNADGRIIELNLGLRNLSPTWDATMPATAGTTNWGTHLNIGMGTNAQVQNPASTSFTNNTGNNFFERFASQDGYTFGELRNVSVNQDGVLSASYSNGVTLELYQITLADFHSKQNLRQEGGNLFTETRESGMPITGAANTGTFGTTNSNSLEQSNVDLAREFVNMIITQKGFQANSKTVTTVDTMLDTVIQMKR